MINTHHPRWYHNFMPSFGFQISVLFACCIITFVQLMVYEGIEEDVVVFDGECTYESVLNDDGEPTSALLVDCGEYSLQLPAHQERLVHFRELTTGERTVIVCTKTVSEYLQQERHSCIIDPQPEEEV
jgi:hypothetical protein